MRVLAGTLTRKLSSDRQSMVVTQTDTFGGSVSFTIALSSSDGELVGVVSEISVKGHYRDVKQEYLNKFIISLLKMVPCDTRRFIPHGERAGFIVTVDGPDSKLVVITRVYTDTTGDEVVCYDTYLLNGQASCSDSCGRDLVIEVERDVEACYSTYMAPKLHIAFIDEVESLPC